MSALTTSETNPPLPGAAPEKLPTMLDHALAAARRPGFAVFPLQAGTKEPLAGSAGHKGATREPAEIRAMWTCPVTGSILPYNIGVTPHDGRHVVIDLDVKDGRNGISNYETLGGKVAGLVVATPSGGRHIWCLGDDLRTTAGEIAEGVDSRGADGYVVAPGSVIDGVAYEVIENGEPLPCPQFVVDKIGTRAAREIRHVTQCAVESDQPHNIERAIEVAKRHPPAISGTWHTLGYPLGCELARCALSPEMALRVAGEHWKPRGEGFKSQAQFERDILGGYHDAVRDGEHGVSSLDAQRLAFDGLTVVLPTPDAEPRDEEAPSPGRLRFTRQTDCTQGEPREYVVKNLLARGDVAIVLGQPGAGKSAVTPLICQAVANGAPVFSRKTRQGTVLYVAAEDPHGMRGRLQALGECHGSAANFILVDGATDLFSADGQAVELLARVRAGRPALVVIDTLAAAFPGLRENESDDMGKVIRFARALATNDDGGPGPAVILLHHTPKGDPTTPRGHGSLGGAADVVLLLNRDSDTGIVTVSLTKNRNGIAFGVSMAFTVESALIGLDSDNDPVTAAMAVEVDPATRRAGRIKLTPTEAKALGFLRDLIEAGGPEVRRSAPAGSLLGVMLPDTAHVTVDDWRAACASRFLAASQSGNSQTVAFNRAMKGLDEKNVIASVGGLVWPRLPVSSSNF